MALGIAQACRTGRRHCPGFRGVGQFARATSRPLRNRQVVPACHEASASISRLDKRRQRTGGHDIGRAIRRHRFDPRWACTVHRGAAGAGGLAQKGGLAPVALDQVDVTGAPRIGKDQTRQAGAAAEIDQRCAPLGPRRQSWPQSSNVPAPGSASVAGADQVDAPCHGAAARDRACSRSVFHVKHRAGGQLTRRVSAASQAHAARAACRVEQRQRCRRHARRSVPPAARVVGRTRPELSRNSSVRPRMRGEIEIRRQLQRFLAAECRDIRRLPLQVATVARLDLQLLGAHRRARLPSSGQIVASRATVDTRVSQQLQAASARAILVDPQARAAAGRGVSAQLPATRVARMPARPPWRRRAAARSGADAANVHALRRQRAGRHCRRAATADTRPAR